MSLKEIFKNNWFYILIYALLVVFAFIIKWNFIDELDIIDTNIMNFVQNKLVSNKLTIFMKFITILGSYYIIPIICLILLFIIKDKRIVFNSVLIMIFTVLFNIILKFSIKRPRPLNMLVQENFYSFPSGHAMCSIVFYGILMHIFNRKCNNVIIKILLIILLTILMLLICFSRIYLNVHYFSDIICGIIYGLITLSLIIRILREYDL